MAYETLKWNLDRGVLVLSFNRPDQMNTWVPAMMYEFLDALERIDADDDVRVVVVTGEGRAFSAGADLASSDAFDYEKRDDLGEAYVKERRDYGGKITIRILRSPKPFIAAINGHAVGFGLTVTISMDIRIASEKAKFSFPFTRRGITLDAAGGWFLPRIVPMHWATDWVYSGRTFLADEALRGGLVRSIHPPEQVLPKAIEIAREIADYASPVGVAVAKQMLWRCPVEAHPIAANRIDSATIFALGEAPDAKEGVTAFFEKRKPKFTARVSRDIPLPWPWWEEPEW